MRAVWGLAAVMLSAGCGQTGSHFDAGPVGDGGCVGVQQPFEGACHELYGTPIAYQSNPPTSGCHWPCWAPYGVSSTVIPEEQWVHNLEHGGVVLTYRCQDATRCPDAGAALAAIYAQAPPAPTGGVRVVVTADPTIPTAFAASAWTWSYTSDTPDPAAFLCFIQAHQGQGPEDIASGGSCQ